MRISLALKLISNSREPQELLAPLTVTRASFDGKAFDLLVIMVYVSVARSAHELDKLRPRWEALAAMPGHTMFQSFVWNRLAANVFAQREAPRVVFAESDSGMAIIPAVQRAGELGLLGENLFDYRDVLAAGDRAVLARAWQELALLGLPFRLTALREDAQNLTAWPASVLSGFAEAPMVRRTQLDEAGFRRMHRRLGNRSRRIPRRGIELRRYRGGGDDIRKLVLTVYKRKADQNSGHNLFTDELRRAFMWNIIEIESCNCNIWTYECNSCLVATLISFTDGNVRRFYTTWFDPQWAEISPGQMLLFEATAQTLSEDLDADFMTGEYLYKNRLATDFVKLYCVNASSEMVGALGNKGESAQIEAA